MSKNMPQIALDFGPEPSPPPQKKEVGEPVEPMSRQYMAAGVGVRIKSLKSATTVSGDLFANGAEEPAPTTLAAPANPVAGTPATATPTVELPALVHSETAAPADITPPPAMETAPVAETVPEAETAPVVEASPAVEASPVVEVSAAVTTPRKAARVPRS